MTTLYVAMESELLTLTDEGGSWRQGTHLAGLSVGPTGPNPAAWVELIVKRIVPKLRDL